MEEALSLPIGASLHSIIEDGRFIIPQRVREMLGDSFYLTRGVEQCLWMLPSSVYTSLYQQIAGGEMSLLDRDSRMLGWRFVGQAVQVQPDKQFRIAIPSELAKSAGLEASVIALPMFNRVELWDTKTWRDYEASLSGDEIQAALNRKLGLASPAAAVA